MYVLKPTKYVVLEEVTFSDVSVLLFTGGWVGVGYVLSWSCLGCEGDTLTK